MKLFFLFIALCMCPVLFAGSFPAERIETFSSCAAVKPDASITVTETLVVRANGNKIRRGIFRVLPYKGVSEYEIVSVLRDGRPEPYKTETTSSAKTVYIGSAGSRLSPGLYTYQLAYVLKGAVRFQKNFDEFYWNVTGNEWQFPIERASFRLSLPPGAEVVPDGISFYTGLAGEKGHDARLVGELFVSTTRPLSPQEGFTVSVAWNKGALKEPSAFDKYKWQIAGFSAGWILLWIYYACVLRWVGRKPESRVVRCFEPPEDISPAQTCYLYSRGRNRLTLSVALLSLLQKGFVHVKKNQAEDFMLIRTDLRQEAFLSAEERACLTALFKTQKKLVVSESNRMRLKSAYLAVRKVLGCWNNTDTAPRIEDSAVSAVLNSPRRDRFFFRYIDWVHIPTFVFAFVLFVSLESALLAVALCMVGSIAVVLVNRIFKLSDTASVYIGFGIALFGLCGPVITALVFCAFVPSEIFGRLLPLYTVEGQYKMNQLLGFLEYLKVAETNRVFASNPTDAARVYCNYLPYAVALGVQNQWWNAFENALGATAAQEALASQGYSVMKAGEFSALASAIASASVTSSSSSSSGSSSGSGFGGGGCSGGGSGGGGGGGW